MDISTEIAAVQAASEGSELRNPLIGALNKLNSGTLPAVTASDTGKILKVGTNGWEVGEKSGYMPVPTATKQITENGSYDVTDFANAQVYVSGGSGGISILSGTGTPSDDIGINGQIYLQYNDKRTLPQGYTVLNSITTTGSQWIDTNFIPSYNTKIDAIVLIENYSASSGSFLFGTRAGLRYDMSTKDASLQYLARTIGGSTASINPYMHYAEKVNVISDSTGLYIKDLNGNVLQSAQSSATSGTATNSLYLFTLRGYDASTAGKYTVYDFKIYDDSILVRHFVPAKRDVDDVIGLYDMINDVFYTNIGTGEFLFEQYNLGEILFAYCKINGVWQNLIGANIDNVIIE